MSDIDLVVVKTFLNRFEADVAKSALDAADIQSLVRPDDAGGMEPGLWVGNGIEVLVSAEDAERAQEVLDSIAQPEPSSRD
jgi:hypothetical protein